MHFWRTERVLGKYNKSVCCLVVYIKTVNNIGGKQLQSDHVSQFVNNLSSKLLSSCQSNLSKHSIHTSGRRKNSIHTSGRRKKVSIKLKTVYIHKAHARYIPLTVEQISFACSLWSPAINIFV